MLPRLLRPPLRAFRQTRRRFASWRRRRRYIRKRRRFTYYHEVARLAREYVPQGGRVLDVGGGRSFTLDLVDWFDERVCLDKRWLAASDEVESLLGDVRTFQPPRRFDLVLCLQMLEHLPDAAEVGRRLFELGHTVIVSVPLNWPAGSCKGHIHDPVDEAKVRGWLGREADAQSIIEDAGRERLILVYSNCER